MLNLRDLLLQELVKIIVVTTLHIFYILASNDIQPKPVRYVHHLIPPTAQHFHTHYPIFFQYI